jgi:hypothetical protein
MMKIKSWILIAQIGWCLQTSSSGAETNTTVAPFGLENTPGNSHDNYVLRFPVEYQQVFKGSYLSDIWQTPVEITGIAFRVDSVNGDYQAVIPSVEIQFSTTQRAPNQMSTDMASNKGVDNTVVYKHDDVTLSAQGTLVLNPFQLRFNFDRPFYYDPAAGNLLMDLRTGGDTIHANRGLDAQVFETWGPSTPYALVEPTGVPSTPSNFVAGQALVTEFTWRAIPEPSALALWIAGGLAFFGIKACKR